ncbi:hypothetical protein Gorai_005027 [Gossypium raimondii]|uniref:Uncharacterized protein n=1 Tax=Gossypium raimondii TaxID=29730 RepID=A0A7J8QL84_GOSRA|nr:hypothetical protein [Gossypium raimondii]
MPCHWQENSRNSSLEACGV